ncbi:unnamed protein product, partial [Cyprideis torosa]
MMADQENQRYLPDVALPELLVPVSSLESLVRSSRDILIAVPSEGFRSLLVTIKPWLRPDARLVWATKGFESSTGDFLHDVVSEVIGDVPQAVLSGPSFAAEVGRGLPTALTIASKHDEWLTGVVELFHRGNMRVYSSRDMRGVQLGGAVKNVMAIAAGISAGLHYGSNARAALITRGLAEIMRLGESLGAD